jgi:hypothetical protein
MRFEAGGWSFSARGGEGEDSAENKGVKSSDWMRLYVVLVGVRAARVMNGSRRVASGAGGMDSRALARALSSSSIKRSDRWYARLVGTRISEGLVGGLAGRY